MSSPPLKRNDPVFPAIPEPAPTIESLMATVQRLREAVELLTGQRGTASMQEQYSLQGVLRELKGEGARVYELNEVSSGLARRVEGVEAVSGDVSASGQVVISAEANPAGYKAYFGVYLRATADSVPGTERRAGLHLGLTNADGGVAAFDVDKFIIRDNSSGTTSQVFSYAAGNFTLTGSVTVNGSLIVSGTITTGGIGFNQVGQFTQTSGASANRVTDDNNWVEIGQRTITGVAGGYAFIYADVEIFASNNPSLAGRTVYLRIRKSTGTVLKLAPHPLSSSPNDVALRTLGAFDADATANYTYYLECNTAGTPAGYNVVFTTTEFTAMVHKR